MALQDAAGNVVAGARGGTVQAGFLKGLVNDLTNYCTQGLDLSRYPCMSKISPYGVTTLRREEMGQFVRELVEVMAWAATEYGEKQHEAHKAAYEGLVAMAQACGQAEGMSLRIVGE
ncbi:MAG: hypothetical protein EXR49_00660 [Dehalococcoidia bacterium]|nr:hypothetical protein [Dehalococcoidia bacterium]